MIVCYKNKFEDTKIKQYDDQRNEELIDIQNKQIECIDQQSNIKSENSNQFNIQNNCLKELKYQSNLS